MEKKIELGLPDKLALFHRGSSLEIVRTWFGWQIVFLTAFAIIWDGFLWLWYSKAFASGQLIAILFPLLHVAVGIGVTYYVVAGWLNRTYIVVDGGKISVRHAPLPWLGAKELDASSLKQLYSKEKRPQYSNRGTVTYEVRAITYDGRNVKLVDGLEASEQGLYIEQEIEKYLGIEDLHVKGEISG